MRACKLSFSCYVATECFSCFKFRLADPIACVYTSFEVIVYEILRRFLASPDEDRPVAIAALSPKSERTLDDCWARMIHENAMRSSKQKIAYVGKQLKRKGNRRRVDCTVNRRQCLDGWLTPLSPEDTQLYTLLYSFLKPLDFFKSFSSVVQRIEYE